MKLVTYGLLLAPLAALAVVVSSCSAGDESGAGDQSDSGAGGGGEDAPITPPKDGGQGQDASKGKGDSGGGKPVDASVGPDANDASTITDAPAGDDGGWVDMNGADGAADPYACDNRPGDPCGWSATNNGLGYTCRCANPTWADPWGCEPPDSGAPEMCSAPDAGVDSSTGGGDSGGSDASAGKDASDASAITDASADGGWVDMTYADGAADPYACDNRPGESCGWSTTNNGLGYTCRCVNPTWADPWGCEPPDSGIPAACP